MTIFRDPNLLHHICLHHLLLHEISDEIAEFVILLLMICKVKFLVDIFHTSNHAKKLVTGGYHLVCSLFDADLRGDISEQFSYIIFLLFFFFLLLNLLLLALLSLCTVVLCLFVYLHEILSFVYKIAKLFTLN